MQFHLNGFHEGDPVVAKPAEGREAQADELPASVDVLIVGSGPAGLTLAAQLAAFSEIQTRIVDKREGPMLLGQADGVSCRSMEMFNAFGFADQVQAEGYAVNETSFWQPDPNNGANIIRAGRVRDVEEGLSEMPHMILNQARVHDYFLHVMRNSPSRLEVDYGRELIDLIVDREQDDFPVSVTLQCIDKDGSSVSEIISARYVVGCDGARSRVRAAIGRELSGDYAFQAWGVMDILLDTNFPDIRFKSIVQSAENGNVLVIPREGGYLVRIYVELDSLDVRGESRVTSIEYIIARAQRIFSPFRFDVKDVAWWLVYEMGHSLTDKFDDVAVADVPAIDPCVFIAGDAFHTHSAKAGQGMNVSMGDTFNLGWKLISVLRGVSPTNLLHTYSAERQALAQGLIDFDHRWSRIMSAPPSRADEVQGVPLVQQHFVAGGEFTAGLSVKYEHSALTANPTWQHLAQGFEIGTRFHSAPVVRLADAQSLHLGHVIKADARWHLFLFASADENLSDQSDFLTLCEFLSEHADSPINRYTPEGLDSDTLISTCAVFQQHHHAVEFEALPDHLKPRKGRFGMTDYEKAYCSDLSGDADIFDMRRIDRTSGCVVFVRPDQYVAHVLPLGEPGEVSSFFAAIFH